MTCASHASRLHIDFYRHMPQALLPSRQRCSTLSLSTPCKMRWSQHVLPTSACCNQVDSPSSAAIVCLCGAICMRHPDHAAPREHPMLDTSQALYTRLCTFSAPRCTSSGCLHRTQPPAKPTLAVAHALPALPQRCWGARRHGEEAARDSDRACRHARDRHQLGLQHALQPPQARPLVGLDRPALRCRAATCSSVGRLECCRFRWHQCSSSCGSCIPAAAAGDGLAKWHTHATKSL